MKRRDERWALLPSLFNPRRTAAEFAILLEIFTVFVLREDYLSLYINEKKFDVFLQFINNVNSCFLTDEKDEVFNSTSIIFYVWSRINFLF